VPPSCWTRALEPFEGRVGIAAPGVHFRDLISRAVGVPAGHSIERDLRLVSERVLEERRAEQTSDVRQGASFGDGPAFDAHRAGDRNGST